MAKSIKKNTVLNMVKTASSIVFPIITIPYINRILSPENIGKVDFSRSFVSYFSLIATLGLYTHAVRECATASDDRNKLSNTVSQLFSINVITTVASFILLGLTLLFFREFDDYRLLIFINSFIILFTTLGTDWLNSAMEDFRYITIRTIAFQVISLLAMFLFVRTKADYPWYMIILTVSSSGANLLNIFYRRRYCTVRFTLNIEWKRHLGPIIWLFVMSLSQVIFKNVDITMLGVMWNDYEVGIYTTAEKIVGMISNIVSSIIFVIMPRLSQYFAKNDFDSANTLLRKLLAFNLGLGLPCVVGVLFLADDITFLVGGSEFAGAASVMRIVVFGFAASLIGGSFLGNAILIPMKQEKYYMIVCCITAVANAIGNALLIPSLGANGAAIASVANGFVILILLLLKIDKRIKIRNLLHVFIDPLIGCAVIALICFICKKIDHLWLRITLSIGVSAAAYFVVLKCLKNEFLDNIARPIFNRIKGKRI